MCIKFITYVAIYLYFAGCEIDHVESLKDDIEYWKPDYKFEDNTFNKTKIFNNNDRPNFRQHEFKSKTRKDPKTSKWPKLSKHHRQKITPRITKMHLMQQEDTTKTPDKYLAEEKTIEVFSPYSIRKQLLQVVKKIPNSNITVDVIGRTVEYNDIVLLKITENTVTSNKYFRANEDKYVVDLPEKKIVFIVHGLSVMGVPKTYCLSVDNDFLQLVSYYVAHLDKFDIFLMPMANPDGIAISTSYIWNKNASPQKDCPGVALDRNFDIAWSNNSTINSCHQDYPGPAPFSEAETMAIRNIFHKYSHKIIAYLNVHAGSYNFNTFKGDAVLYPKGYTDSVSDDDKYIDLKGEIDEVIRNASFQVLSVNVDTLYSWYGKVTGSSVDYASTVYGIPFALELVMQLYLDTDDQYGQVPVYYSDIALSEVWGRIINVIFNYIWKTLNGNEVR